MFILVERVELIVDCRFGYLGLVLQFLKMLLEFFTDGRDDWLDLQNVVVVPSSHDIATQFSLLAHIVHYFLRIRSRLNNLLNDSLAVVVDSFFTIFSNCEPCKELQTNTFKRIAMEVVIRLRFRRLLCNCR